MALQLRYLQTLGSIASESKQDYFFVSFYLFLSTRRIICIFVYFKKNDLFLYFSFLFLPLDNSTIVFPIPIDLVSSLIPTLGRGVNNDGDDCDDDYYYFYECADILKSFRPQDQA